MASPVLFPGKVKPQTVGLLGAALPSPMGDAIGLLGDALGYAEDPSSLTPAAGLLSLAGAVPGVPSKALWVDVAGKPITNKALRKALKFIRAEESVDDQIVGLANAAQGLSDYVPVKADMLDALKTLEKHKGTYFPGPSMVGQSTLPSGTVRQFGPPKPLPGGVVLPPYSR